jgi:hypothetical protein
VWVLNREPPDAVETAEPVIEKPPDSFVLGD